MYLTEIRGTEADPFLDKATLTVEKRIADRKAAKEAEEKKANPTPAPAETDTTIIEVPVPTGETEVAPIGDDAEVQPAGSN